MMKKLPALVGALLCSTPALAAYNEYMPTITVGPGGSIQNALNQAAAGANSTVTLMPGAYTIATPLLIASNTRLVCSPGAVITENVDANWSGDLAGVENVNHAASALTDQNIEIQGCTFNFINGANSAAFHHIRIIFASHVNIHDNKFNNGGDGTAMIATYDTVVRNNYGNILTNACWDNYDGPNSFVVRDNVCSTISYGVLATGSGGGYPTPAVPTIAKYGTIAGNTINMLQRTGFAGIWLQGLGGTGSGDGAQNVVVTNNHVYGDGVANFTCFKVSGASTNDSVLGNQCVNPGPNSQGLVVSGPPGDPAGAPTDIIFDGNTVDSVNVASGNVAAIVVAGNNVKMTNNRIKNGSFPSCVWLDGVDDTAINNLCDPNWTAGEYNLAGATRPKYSSSPAGAGNYTLGAPAGNIVVGQGSAMGNGATGNFLSPPFTNGIPTGTPASTGLPACVWNDASGTLNCYSPSAGAWKHMTFSAGGG